MVHIPQGERKSDIPVTTGIWEAHVPRERSLKLSPLFLPPYPHLMEISTPQWHSRSMGNSRTTLGVLIFTLSLVGYANAAHGWGDIANNLGSDLAPLLALFGEQVTKQYLGESLSWVDNIIFALAPMGILTAIVSAIRVSGDPRLRSLIGRAKESRGIVEADLMSSTSSDVCELWNGESVVRVLGSPVLLQLVHLQQDPATNEPAICTFDEAVKQGFYIRKKNNGYDMESEGLSVSESPPNLSLNVSIEPLDKSILWLFVVLGVSLQTGVLVFAAFIQYRLHWKSDEESIGGYAFPVILMGTIILSIGMFLCAQVIEKSTKETSWEPRSGLDTEVIWIQQGGQIVGDQLFESFARSSRNCTVTTSEKAEEKTEVLVYIATGASLVGFIAQFVGLREMHASVIVAQLGAIIIMTIIRTCAHIRRKTDNDIKDPTRVDGHELDWLARSLKGCEEWEIVTGINNQDYSIHQKPSDPLQNQAIAVMKTRARLAHLSSSWTLENRSKVKILKSAIEATINQVYAVMTIKPDFNSLDKFRWTLQVKAKYINDQSDESPIELALHREKDESGDWTPWKIDENELEAVLCLWVSFLTEEDKKRAKEHKEPLKHIRLLGQATEEARVDYRLWIHRGTPLNRSSSQPKPGTTRYFGWGGIIADRPLSLVPYRPQQPLGLEVFNDNQEPSGSTHLSINAEEDLATLCTQEVYAWFMFQLVNIIKEVGGKTTRRINDPTREKSIKSHKQNTGWERFRLINSNLSSLAAHYNRSGLGTIEHAYFCIVPALRALDKLPFPHEAFTNDRKASKRLEREGLWEKASEIYWWMYENSRETKAEPLMIELAATDLGKHLRRLSHQLTQPDSKRLSGQNIAQLWQMAYSGCQKLSDHVQADRILSLIDLYTSETESERQDALKLMVELGQQLNIRMRYTARILVIVGKLALERSWFEDAEVLAKMAWASEIMLSVPDTLDGAATLLMEIRLRSGKFLSKSQITTTYLSTSGTCISGKILVSEIGQYRGRRFEIPPLNLSIHETPTEGSKPIGSSVPIDLLLARRSGTLLQSAALHGITRIVQYLLSTDADVNARPSPFQGFTALQAAAKGGNLEIFKQLLEVGADVNAAPAEDSGRTALQAAAERGHVPIVKLILANGADVNAAPAPKSGRTALQAASESGHENILILLLEAKADVNAAPSKVEGLTALQAASRNGHEKIVERLLNNGADVNAPPAQASGLTALQAAAEGGSERIIRQLLEAEASVNAEPAKQSGKTALQAAVHGCHQEIVEILLTAGANVNSPPGGSSGRTALQAAAEIGHSKILELLLENKADVDAEPAKNSGRTALQAAAGAGHQLLVDLLLSCEININAPPAEVSGRTAIQAAAAGGHETIVKRLLENGADVNAAPAPDSGRTALQAAAEGGHEMVVELLLEACAEVNAMAAEDSGRTALQAAAEHGHDIVVEMLLEAGADVNAPQANYSGRTALHASSENGHVRIVERLLAAGAEVNALPLGPPWRTALQAAAENGYTTVFNILASHSTKPDFDAPASEYLGRTALQGAAENGHEEIVKRIIQSKADIDAPPARNGGRTALQAAAQRGHVGVVKLLLKEGADVNYQPCEHSGRTALQAAAEGGHEEIVPLLIEAGADVNALPAEYLGETALQAAVGSGRERIVKLLLELGADPNAESSKDLGRTALQIAADNDYQSIFELLISARANINTLPTGPAGRTVLQAAANHGHEKIMDLLLDLKADVNLVSTSGHTALQLAAENGHERIVERLLTAGADPTAGLYGVSKNGHEKIVKRLLDAGANASTASESGQTALHAAAGNGHERIVKILLNAGADPNTAIEAAAENNYYKILGRLERWSLPQSTGIDMSPEDDVGDEGLDNDPDGALDIAEGCIGVERTEER